MPRGGATITPESVALEASQLLHESPERLPEVLKMIHGIVRPYRPVVEQYLAALREPGDDTDLIKHIMFNTMNMLGNMNESLGGGDKETAKRLAQKYMEQTPNTRGGKKPYVSKQMPRTRMTKKFDRCVKSVRKTVRARKGSTKESAAIAICTKSVLHKRGRTLKRYRKGRLTTQKKFRGGVESTVLAQLYTTTLTPNKVLSVDVTSVPNWQAQIAELKAKIARASEEEKSTLGRLASFVRNRVSDIASKEDTLKFLDELAVTGKIAEEDKDDLQAYVKRIEKSAA